MIYVARIDSTIKVGVEDMDLAPKVLITGPNESGKSTVVDAITLALGGFIYDAAGREIVRDNNVLVRMSGDPKRLMSQAVLSDGQKSTYSVTRTKKGAGKDRGVRPVPARFPFQEVREHLRSSPDSLRKWLLRSMGATLSEAQLVSTLSPTSQAVWTALTPRLQGEELVDRFLHAIEEAKATVKAHAAAQKATTETVDALAQGLGPRPDPTALEQLRASVQTLQATLPRVIRSEQAPASEQVQAARLEKEAVDQRLREITATLQAARGAEIGVQARQRLQAALTAGRCGSCGRDFTVGVDQVAAYAQALAQLPVLNPNLIQEQRTLSFRAHQLDAFLRGAGAMQPETFTVTSQQVQQSIDAGIRDLATREATLHTYKRIDELRSQQDHAKAFARDCATFVEEAAETIRATIEVARDRFVAAVNKRLSGKDFYLELTETVDGKPTPVCRLGLINDKGMLQTALTGSTQVRLTLALAAAVMELTPAPEGEEPVVLYLPEDKGFDPDNLARLLHDLRDAPGQVIITSPIVPTHIPDEFRHISIEGVSP